MTTAYVHRYGSITGFVCVAILPHDEPLGPGVARDQATGTEIVATLPNLPSGIAWGFDRVQEEVQFLFAERLP